MNSISKSFLICWFFLAGVNQTQADENNDTSIVSPPPNFRILDKWRGTWLVTATRHQPDPKTITYVETYNWVLNQRFLRGESARKSDGTQAMSMIWYDVYTESYRFVLYDSSEPKPADVAAEAPPPWGGIGVELPPPVWHDDTQTMEWDSGFFGPVRYTGRTRFINDDMIVSSGILKDWKGTVIVDVETISIRQK